jgi:hypothetical protein
MTESLALLTRVVESVVYGMFKFQEKGEGNESKKRGETTKCRGNIEYIK